MSDGGGPSDCLDVPPATTVDGVRSAYPHITYTLAEPFFRLLSVNYVVTVDGDPRGPLLTLYAEIERTASGIECSFLPDIYLDSVDLVGLIETPPYYSDLFFGNPDDCLGPGDIGVLEALARGVSSEDLATASNLFIDVSPNTYDDYYRATDTPTITEEMVSTSEGWAIRGTMRTIVDIYNYSYRAYVRDSRDLIVDELLAFPRKLGNIYVGEVIDYETSATPCRFVGARSYQGWIHQRRSTSASVPPDVSDVVRRAQDSRAAQIRELVEIRRDPIAPPGAI